MWTTGAQVGADLTPEIAQNACGRKGEGKGEASMRVQLSCMAPKAPPLRAIARACGCLSLALATAACSTSVQTPLPDLKPVASTSMSQAEQKKAVEELNRKRATHEEDAEAQIEQSR